MNQALEDILLGKLGTRRAAVIYGIPRSTLRNKVYKLEKTSPLGSSRLSSRRARQQQSAGAVTSTTTTAPQTTTSVTGGLKSESPSLISTSAAVKSPSLLKKEPKIMGKTRVKRKGAVNGKTPSPTILDTKPSMEETTSDNYRASELLKQMLRDNIVNKKPSSLSSTASALSSSPFNSKTNPSSASDPFNPNLPMSMMMSSNAFDASSRSSSREDEDNLQSSSSLFDPNSRLKAALNQGVGSSMYQPQLFAPQVPTPGNASLETSLVNPFDMFSSLDQSALQTLAPLIYAYYFDRLLLASTAAAAAASNPSTSPTTTIIPNMIPTVNSFNPFLQQQDPDPLKEPLKPSTNKRRREEKVPEEEEDTSNKSSKNGPSITSGSKNRPKRGRYRNYDREALDKAVEAVQKGEMSVHRAGTHFGVPHSTLEYKVKQRHLLREKKRLNSNSQSIEEGDASPIENGQTTLNGDLPSDSLTPALTSDAATPLPSSSLTPTSEDGSIGLE